VGAIIGPVLFLCGHMLTAAIERSDTGYPLRQLIWLLSHPLSWAALGLVIGPYLFYRGFRLLQRKRLILDIPRSAVRAAAMGGVEVSGQAVGPYTLVRFCRRRKFSLAFNWG
jgi:hypothetical protein